MYRRPLASLLAAIFLAWTASADAQPAAPGDDQAALGRLYASSYLPIPDGVPMTVRPWDNSAINLRVKSSLAEALGKRGLTMANSGAALTFNFETEVESLLSVGTGPSLGRVDSRNYGAVPETRIQMNFWSNTQDSIVTGRRNEHGGSAAVRYVLRATIDDSRSGQRLWQGEANYTGAPADERAAFVAMVPILIEAYGQTVRPKSFRLN